MKNAVSALVLFLAGMTGISMPMAAYAAPSPETEKPAKKTPPKKASAKKDAAAAERGSDKEPDVAGMTSTAYDCELGNKLTIYSNPADDQQITLRWNKRLHPMTRVGTTTGALRFENTQIGLVWIGIPAKGMLLDSKKGKQLANECKSLEQTASPAAGTS